MGMYIAPIWIRGLNINVFKGEGILLVPHDQEDYFEALKLLSFPQILL